MTTPPYSLALQRIALQLNALTTGETPHSRFYSADSPPPTVPAALQYDKTTRPLVAEAAKKEGVARVRRGVYVSTPESVRTFDAEFLTEVRGVVEVLDTDFWISHTAAARLHGLWTYRDPGHVHVIHEYLPSVQDEGRLIRHWSKRLPARDRTVVGGIPVTTLERTMVDVACSAPLSCALVVVTAGFRAGADPVVVGQILDERAGGRGVVQARRVMELCDPDCASPGEVLMRLAAILAGLPHPQVQVPVAIPGGTAWLDIGWPAVKAGLEFDGAVKFSGLLGDPLAARDRQSSRQAEIEHAGWQVESVVWDETVEFEALQERISAFYRRAATRLSRSSRPVLASA